MTLLVTLFLTLTNIFNKIPGTSPKVEGFNALSAWVLSCILFVFGALIGYAAILFKKNFFWEVNTNNNNQILPFNKTLNLLELTMFVLNRISRNVFFQISPEDFTRTAQIKLRKENHLRNIDRAFIVLFPLLFLLFNFTYWITFLKP